MNSLPGSGRASMPVGFGGIVGREQQQDLRLQRIGVLEFVDEDVREAMLQFGAHAALSRTRSRAISSRSRKSSTPARFLASS